MVYLKIYHTGKFLYLTDRPDCAEYYAAEQLFLTDPYFRHPDTHRVGLFLMKGIDSEESQNWSKRYFLCIRHCPSLLFDTVTVTVKFFSKEYL